MIRRAASTSVTSSRCRVTRSVKRVIGIVKTMQNLAVTIDHVGSSTRWRTLGLRRLARADQDEDRGVLLQADEVVQQRRDHLAHGLRHHDVAHRLEVVEAERARGHALALVHPLDAGAESSVTYAVYTSASAQMP